MDDFIEKLGWPPNGALQVSDMQMVTWGRSLIFRCRYIISADEQKDFNLVFEDCRDIKYKVYAHISLADIETHSPPADVAELLVGLGNHRRDAQLLTNHFAVVVSYGTLHMEIGTERHSLNS